MGLVSEKCSCFKEDDKYIFDVDKESQKETIIQAKSNKINKSTEQEIFTKTKELKQKYLGLNDHSSFDKFLKLQSKIHSIIFRRKYIKKFQSLLLEENREIYEMILSLGFECKDYKKSRTFCSIDEINIKLPLKGEFKSIIYDPEGWRRFYPNEDKIFILKFGKVYKTKFLIDYTQFGIYSGTVNINNKKHGLGTFIKNDGSYYKGNWLNDKLSGWSYYSDSTGSVFIGKFFK